MRLKHQGHQLHCTCSGQGLAQVWLGRDVLDLHTHCPRNLTGAGHILCIPSRCPGCWVFVPCCSDPQSGHPSTAAVASPCSQFASQLPQTSASLVRFGLPCLPRPFWLRNAMMKKDIFNLAFLLPQEWTPLSTTPGQLLTCLDRLRTALGVSEINQAQQFFLEFLI